MSTVIPCLLYIIFLIIYYYLSIIRIKFNKLQTRDGKINITFDGDTYTKYNVSDIVDSGIDIPDTCKDYSLIKIKGSSKLLSNLDVISSIAVSANSPENFIFDFSKSNEFPNCITHIVIPDKVTSIGYGAFAYYTGLVDVTIPNTVISIGSAAFTACTSLTNINLPESLKEIDEYAFSESGLTDVIIPEGVIKIGRDAFYKSNLKSVNIPKSVAYIGPNAFPKSLEKKSK